MNQVQQIDSELMRLEGEFMQLASSGKEFNRDFYPMRMKQLADSKDRLLSELHRRLEKSVQLESDANQLKQLQIIADEMRTRLERLEIDRSQPSRITQLHAPIATSAEGAADPEGGT
jgi:hypothetical protein